MQEYYHENQACKVQSKALELISNIFKTISENQNASQTTVDDFHEQKKIFSRELEKIQKISERKNPKNHQNQKNNFILVAAPILKAELLYREIEARTILCKKFLDSSENQNKIIKNLNNDFLKECNLFIENIENISIDLKTNNQAINQAYVKQYANNTINTYGQKIRLLKQHYDALLNEKKNPQILKGLEGLEIDGIDTSSLAWILSLGNDLSKANLPVDAISEFLPADFLGDDNTPQAISAEDLKELQKYLDGGSLSNDDLNPENALPNNLGSDSDSDSGDSSHFNLPELPAHLGLQGDIAPAVDDNYREELLNDFMEYYRPVDDDNPKLDNLDLDNVGLHQAYLDESNQTSAPPAKKPRIV